MARNAHVFGRIVLCENAHRGGRWKIVEEWGGIPDLEKGIARVAGLRG